MTLRLCPALLLLGCGGSSGTLATTYQSVATAPTQVQAPPVEAAAPVLEAADPLDAGALDVVVEAEAATVVPVDAPPDRAPVVVTPAPVVDAQAPEAALAPRCSTWATACVVPWPGSSPPSYVRYPFSDPCNGMNPTCLAQLRFDCADGGVGSCVNDHACPGDVCFFTPEYPQPWQQGVCE